MGSVGFGEIAFIAIIALLVFGPERLPELARRAGGLMTKAREATRSFTDALDSEFKEAGAPIRSLKADFEATKDELRTAAGTVIDMNLDVSITGQNPVETVAENAEDSDPSTSDGETEDLGVTSSDTGTEETDQVNSETEANEMEPSESVSDEIESVADVSAGDTEKQS